MIESLHESDFDYVIGIGTSAGGVEALNGLIASLPAGLRAPIIIAMHSAPASRLQSVLQAASPLEITEAQDGMPLRAGVIYVVPGGFHVLFNRNRMRLIASDAQAGHRPSIDMMFVSMGSAYGRYAVGIVLSGTMKDGTHGVQALRKLGGIIFVQSPSEAKFESMPRNVIENDEPDGVLPVFDIGDRLVALVGTKPKATDQ